jgi:tetrahydromethanopterin S-methyltransferase subunit F
MSEDYDYKTKQIEEDRAIAIALLWTGLAVGVVIGFMLAVLL